jgi:alkaline phosphatase
MFMKFLNREGFPEPPSNLHGAVAIIGLSPTWRSPAVVARLLLATILVLTLRGPATAQAPLDSHADRLRALQAQYVAGKAEARPRAYHFGSQGAGDVFSNHTSHTNRLVPVYVFGRKADLGAVTGEHSRYRDPEQVRALYGRLPEFTVNPEATYADQSDLYRVQADAVARGVKHLFIVWFDGLDWDTTRAAAVAKSGRDYAEGMGSGLIFQDYTGAGPVQFGFVVTSPTTDTPDLDASAQTVKPRATMLSGGYDAEIAGPTPWAHGPLGPSLPGYLKGQLATASERQAVTDAGRARHAFTDSSCSAGEVATGVKAFNNGVNVADDGRFLTTLFERLQGDGWKVGTATSVPFNHASPAAFYAHNVFRDDYQDLAREMLGLPSIVQQTGKHPRPPGLDVVLGTGHGIIANESALRRQGDNAVPGPLFITDADRAAIDVGNGGRYVVVETTPGVQGSRAVRDAAIRAARGGQRLFGLFGRDGLDHLPYRTADGRFDPAPGVRGTAEVYTPADLFEQPTLADMTEAALTVLAAEPGRPFALFVEAGDVDFALHDNNLDNAIGAIYSGEDAIRVILDWVEQHSDWDESLLIVTSDHGHYLVLDDPSALAGAARPN